MTDSPVMQVALARCRDGAQSRSFSTAELVRAIDHTCLRADADRGEIIACCREAREHGFYAVCVNSGNVALCATELEGSKTVVCGVVGFPLGATSSRAKAYEASEAVRAGAAEIDMVMNRGLFKSGDYGGVVEDVRAVVEAVKPAAVKVIIETAGLDAEGKVIACVLAKVAGASFVKTCTGFGGGGATVEDVVLMKRVVGPRVAVKASGGIRTRDQACAMLEAGASRIGTSAGVTIVGDSD